MTSKIRVVNGLDTLRHTAHLETDVEGAASHEKLNERTVHRRHLSVRTEFSWESRTVRESQVLERLKGALTQVVALPINRRERARGAPRAVGGIKVVDLDFALGKDAKKNR